MEDTDLKKMWETCHQQVDEARALNLQAWALNIKTIEYVQAYKAQSRLHALCKLKKRAVAFGIVWVFFLGLLVYGNRLQNMYFTVSVCMLMLFSVAAMVVYIRQIVRMRRINFSDTVVNTQQQFTRLQASGINIHRVLWLQMPFYTTFFWSTPWLAGDYLFWLTAFPITLFFTYLSFWLFKNISLENADKKWFKILLSREWAALSGAKNYLDEILAFKNGQ